MKKRKRRTGFTRTELMVVGGCLTLFTFILLPGLTGAREAGKRAICLSNLKTLGAGMLLYAQDYEGKIPAWGWQFDEIDSQGDPAADWVHKTTLSLTKSFEYAYIWEYILSKRPFVCPSLTLLHNPKPNIALGTHSQLVWGWPNGQGTQNPPGPMWSYQLNAQPEYVTDPQSRTNPELVLPSPTTVMMLFEQDCRDYASFDNGISLFNATHQELIDQDTVGPYHMVSGTFQETGPTFAGGTRTLNRIRGRGNLVYFDGHVGDMTNEEFREKRSTEDGTLELIGMKIFLWP